MWDTADDAHEFELAFHDMMYEVSAEEHDFSYWSAYQRYISFECNKNLR